MTSPLTHEDLWSAIDRLAELHGLSTSGLALKAGLDATSFNRSKRVSKDGRERWPSMESINLILAATNTSFQSFAAMITPHDNAKGLYFRRHNEVIHIQPNGSDHSFSYALLSSQREAFDRARMPERTQVEVISPYVDSNGIPRLRGLRIAGQHKPVF